MLTKGMIPIVKMMDIMLSKKTGNEELFDLATESMQLLAFAHRDLSNVRRKMLKPAVAKKYQKLCTPHLPLTSQLFRDDLEKELKSITESKRIGYLATNHTEKSKRPRHSSYHKKPNTSSFRHSHYRQDDASFLDKRQIYRSGGKPHGRTQHQQQQKHKFQK
jgi:hypothetical protein